VWLGGVASLGRSLGAATGQRLALAQALEEAPAGDGGGAAWEGAAWEGVAWCPVSLDGEATRVAVTACAGRGRGGAVPRLRPADDDGTGPWDATRQVRAAVLSLGRAEAAALLDGLIGASVRWLERGHEDAVASGARPGPAPALPPCAAALLVSAASAAGGPAAALRAAVAASLPGLPVDETARLLRSVSPGPRGTGDDDRVSLDGVASLLLPGRPAAAAGQDHDEGSAAGSGSASDREAVARLAGRASLGPMTCRALVEAAGRGAPSDAASLLARLLLADGRAEAEDAQARGGGGGGRVLPVAAVCVPVVDAALEAAAAAASPVAADAIMALLARRASDATRLTRRLGPSVPAASPSSWRLVVAAHAAAVRAAAAEGTASADAPLAGLRRAIEQAVLVVGQRLPAGGPAALVRSGAGLGDGCLSDAASAAEAAGQSDGDAWVRSAVTAAAELLKQKAADRRARSGR